MALKDELFTKVFSEEGTDQSKKDAQPMKPDDILPIVRIAIAFLIAVICVAPIAINIINQGGL